MKRAIYIIITVMTMTAHADRICAQSWGGLVIEEMIKEHRSSALNLGVRSTVETENRQLHNKSRESSKFYQNVQKAYDEYLRLFDVLYTIVQGGATMYNVGTTITDIARRVEDFKSLIDMYYDKCLSHGSIASTDTIIVNVGRRMGESIYKDAKQFAINLGTLQDIAAYATGKAACKTTDLLCIFDNMNKFLDNVRNKIDAAYFTIWKYIMCRAYYWKPSLYAPRGMKVICSDAIKAWAEKAQRAVSKVQGIL